MTTRDEVLAKLAELPDTADGIAAFLTKRGVKGTPCDPRACPIAKYTGAAFVDPLHLTVNLDDPVEDHIPLVSDAAASFMYLFDDRLYPELIA